MKVRTERWGSLKVRLIGPEARAAKGALVLLHGFGAPGDDLVPLAPELLARANALKDVLMVFPEGPMDLSALSPGARAWWLIDFERLAQRQRSDAEALRRVRGEIPDGMTAARAGVESVLDALAAANIPLERIVLGGFSQGSMVATDVALNAATQPAALAIFSGTLIAETHWRARAEHRRGLRVFQSHGTQDPVLAYRDAEALRDLLREGGLLVDFAGFPGGHTIPEAALQGLLNLALPLVR